MPVCTAGAWPNKVVGVATATPAAVLAWTNWRRVSVWRM
jgi:hypothetical protein